MICTNITFFFRKKNQIATKYWDWIGKTTEDHQKAQWKAYQLKKNKMRTNWMTVMTGKKAVQTTFDSGKLNSSQRCLAWKCIEKQFVEIYEEIRTRYRTQKSTPRTTTINEFIGGNNKTVPFHNTGRTSLYINEKNS